MALLDQLKQLVTQIDDGSGTSCCPAPCPAATIQCCDPAYVQCCMTCPPPILAPTTPQPVSPLQLPCPNQSNNQGNLMTEEEAERSRFSNYYNNYNVDWHPPSGGSGNSAAKNKCCPEEKRRGTTMSGSNPCCENYETKKVDRSCEPQPGCPTGFKPCQVELKPGCNGVWCAKVHPCPPKPKKKFSNTYEPGACTRPCCKHWKPKEGPCVYDDPCKAACFNHPPGMKPSGRFP